MRATVTVRKIHRTLEALAKDSPSTPFNADASADVWVGPMADSELRPAAAVHEALLRKRRVGSSSPEHPTTWTVERADR